MADLHDVNLAKEAEAFNAGMSDRMEKASGELDSAAGERLSLEDFEDIYMEAMADKRAKANMGRNVRGRDGEINDYLEVRRPLGAPQ